MEFSSRRLLKLFLISVLGIYLCTTISYSDSREGELIDPANNPNYNYYTWPDDPPGGCPFEQSAQITGITFTGRYANYSGADTWYPMWAADGNCYSTWTDGFIEGYECISNTGGNCTGQAKLVGEDPLNLGIINLGKMYSGPAYYPCVSLIANGVFYYGSYFAYDDTGYFEGFRYSSDCDHFTEKPNAGWTDPYWTDARDPDRNFFNETGQAKFRVPHAVVFGQNNNLSPDGKIYLVSHGVSVAGHQDDWDKGDAVYLCRVAANPASVTNAAAYEFFAGRDGNNNPTWTNNVANSQPILDWPNYLGSESLTYIPGLNKYILMTARLKESESNLPYNVVIFWESDRLSGPYKMVHYLKDWGPQTYFPNIPAKFISSDGRKAWFVCASNYSSGVYNPYQCRYACSMHEIMFNIAGETLPTPPPLGVNLAPEATVEASSVYSGYSINGVNDGVIGGYPGNTANEWASNGEKTGAWIKLTWPSVKTITKIRLYDRPNTIDQIRGGTLTFSDSSSEKLNAWLSDGANTSGEVNFPAKNVTWVKFTVDKIKGGSLNIGLAELEVYGDGGSVSTPTPTPAGATYKYDFGTATSPVETGYNRVERGKAYSGGYGWTNTANMEDADRGAPDNIKSDLCYSTQARIFKADLPNGSYSVDVVMGDNGYAHDNMYLKANGTTVASGINTAAAQWTVKSFPVAVTDGTLSLEFGDTGGSDPCWVVNSVVINSSNVTATPTSTPTSTPTPSPAPLFSDNFNDGNDTGWTRSGGTWAVESNEYSGTGAGSSGQYYATAGNTSWSNYTIQADVKIMSSSPTKDVGLIFRAADTSNHYLVALRQGSDTSRLELYKCVSGTFTSLGMAINSLTINADTWYTLKIVLNGSNIQVYLGGTLYIDKTDSYRGSGKIGVRVYNDTHAHFDNITVW
jgi:hypothetical protein